MKVGVNMENLLENMIKTANSFTQNRKDDGNFDYSIESLNDIDKLIKVIAENNLEQHELDIWTSFVSSYVFEVARKTHENSVSYEFSEDAHQPILKFTENNSVVILFVWSNLAEILSNIKTGSMFEHINNFTKEIAIAREKPNYEGLVM